jgi:Na+-translocating ferredoxin:NAD+ oxidoreductase RnfC subunit
MKDDRRIPLTMLRKRLHVEEYEREAPFDDRDVTPRSVRISLLQHMGTPAKPVVGPGDKVSTGDVIGAAEPHELGANIHSSLCGSVRSIADGFIEIVADDGTGS